MITIPNKFISKVSYLEKFIKMGMQLVTKHLIATEQMLLLEMISWILTSKILM